MNAIKIDTYDGEVKIQFEFLDNPAAAVLKKALPIQAQANTWGDEIYFNTGISAPSSGATMNVEVGDIAYWPQGKCLCIFFGKTPASTNDQPSPASEVVIVARSEVNKELLKKVKDGDNVLVS